MPLFKQSDYFKYTRSRPDRAFISDEWIERALTNPDKEEVQSDGRVRKWKEIQEFENRALRVILLEDGETVHNAFFDRDYQPPGQ
jgi:hypothetical protein